MKKIIWSIALIITLISCGHSNQSYVQTNVPSTNNNIQVQVDQIPGFNVQLFANLVKTTANPQVLEKQINDPNTGINMLDLNKDGSVDYLEVVERQNQLIVIDETSPSNKVTIATLNITTNGNMNDVSVIGNQAYCGTNYNYHSGFTLTDALLLGYLLSPRHIYYVPSYHYGHYPSYYHTTSVISTRQKFVTRTVTNSNSVINTNNSSKVAPVPTAQRSSLSEPIKSQKAFNVRDNSKPIKTGGFGNKSVDHTSTSHTSFGSSRSSFGKHR